MCRLEADRGYKLIPLCVRRRQIEEEVADQDDAEEGGHLLPAKTEEAHCHTSGDREDIAEIQRCVVRVEQVTKSQRQWVAQEHQQHIPNLEIRDTRFTFIGANKEEYLEVS